MARQRWLRNVDSRDEQSGLPMAVDERATGASRIARGWRRLPGTRNRRCCARRAARYVNARDEGLRRRCKAKWDVSAPYPSGPRMNAASNTARHQWRRAGGGHAGPGRQGWCTPGDGPTSTRAGVSSLVRASPPRIHSGLCYPRPTRSAGPLRGVGGVTGAKVAGKPDPTRRHATGTCIVPDGRKPPSLRMPAAPASRRGSVTSRPWGSRSSRPWCGTPRSAGSTR